MTKSRPNRESYRTSPDALRELKVSSYCANRMDVLPFCVCRRTNVHCDAFRHAVRSTSMEFYRPTKPSMLANAILFACMAGSTAANAYVDRLPLPENSATSSRGGGDQSTNPTNNPQPISHTYSGPPSVYYAAPPSTYPSTYYSTPPSTYYSTPPPTYYLTPPSTYYVPSGSRPNEQVPLSENPATDSRGGGDQSTTLPQ
jgi:hypothetical protein